MLAAVALILAGLAILWAARDAGDVNADVLRWQSRRASSPRLRRALEFQARITPRATLWFGRAIGLLAIAGGVFLLVRQL